MRSYVHKTADTVQFPPSHEEMSPAFKNVPCVRLFCPHLQLNKVAASLSVYLDVFSLSWLLVVMYV